MGREGTSTSGEATLPADERNRLLKYVDLKASGTEKELRRRLTRGGAYFNDVEEKNGFVEATCKGEEVYARSLESYAICYYRRNYSKSSNVTFHDSTDQSQQLTGKRSPPVDHYRWGRRLKA